MKNTKTKLMVVGVLLLLLNSCSSKPNTETPSVTNEDDAVSIVDNSNTVEKTSCTHQFGQWEIVVSPTCTSDGIQVHRCNLCGHEEGDYIKGEHSIRKSEAKTATCTENGYTEKSYCITCNEVFVESEIIPALGHLEVVDKGYDSTCSSIGYTDGSYCSRCSATIRKQEQISKKAHTLIYNYGYEATCTTDGYSDQTYCVDCQSEISVAQIIPALGHNPNSNNICTRCGVNCPVELKMTSSEISEAKKVYWISDGEINDLQDTKQFRLMFSLKDISENYLKVPVVVEIEIKNDNGEIVYNDINIVKIDDFCGWSNAYGRKWTAAAIYINYSDITKGSTESGTITYTVYNDYVSFDPLTLTIYDNLPLKSSTVILPTLPNTIYDYNWDDRIDSSCIITNITYEIDGDSVYFYFTGEKTYDAEGDKYSQPCQVGWKLYDSDGFIKDSGIFYSPSIAVGEKFRDEEVLAYDVIVPGETYTLKISNVD